METQTVLQCDIDVAKDIPVCHSRKHSPVMT